jgi:hypothetical protein
METNLFAAKLGLLSFWSLWFLIAFLTNLCGGLKSLGFLPAKWKFSSENFRAVTQATAVYRLPRRLAAVLFAGVLLWQLLAVALFGFALASSFKAGALDLASVNAAFAAGLGLFAAFMIADEVFLCYENESGHALLFTAQLVTWMSFYVLP